MRLLVLLCVCLITSCGRAPHESPEAASHALSISPDQAAAGDAVTLTIQNDGGKTVEYNLCASALHYVEGGAWQEIPTDRVCTMELRMLQPGQEASFRVDLPRDLLRGDYRFTTTVHPIPSGEPLHLASPTFHVTDR